MSKDRFFFPRSWRFWLGIAVLGAAFPVLAEVPDPPTSFGRLDVVPLALIPIQNLPPVDLATLLSEDAAVTDKGAPVRLGIDLKAGLSSTNSGLIEPLPEGGMIWRVRVRSAGALWLTLGFGTFRPQPGVMLHVYDPTQSQVMGGYVADDVRDHGQLWTAGLAGDEVVLEIYMPPTLPPAESPNVDLGTVIHGYHDPGIIVPVPLGSCPNGSSDCDTDLACPEGADFQDQKRGVTFLAVWGQNGWVGASGTLLNNTAGNCKNYVLTANHVAPGAFNPASINFFFNYEDTVCGLNNGQATDSVVGSQLRATWNSDDGTDFTLLELDDKPPVSFDVYYNGWSQSAFTPAESWVIHHPNSRPKEISHNSDPVEVAGNDDYWLVEDWENGSTRNGSSGSPLFDQNKRVVGQLYGGGTDCFCEGIEINDKFGRLNRSWAGGGSPATRLRDWLDPAHTNVTAIDGRNRPITTFCFGSWLKFKDFNWGNAPDGSGNGDAVIDPGEMLTLGIDLENPGDVPITGVSALLRSQSAGGSVPQPDLTWPDVPTEDTVASNAPGATVQIAPDVACGDTVSFELAITGTGGNGSWNPNFQLRVGSPVSTTLFSDDMESGGLSWSQQSLEGTSAWALVNTGGAIPNFSWFIADGSARTDTVLQMPFTTIGPESTLRFRQRYDTENSYGGGVLEYIDSTGIPKDLDWATVGGGYHGGIQQSVGTALGGRRVWSGDSNDWQDVEVDLSSLAGQTIQLRWRFATDDSGGDVGWWIDDCVLESKSYDCSELAPGETSDPTGPASSFRVDKSPGGGFDLDWSAPTSGGPPTGYSLYAVPLPGSNAEPKSCEGTFGIATAVTVPTLPDDHAFLVVASNGQGEGSYGTDSSGTERSPAVVPNVCP